MNRLTYARLRSPHVDSLGRSLVNVRAEFIGHFVQDTLLR
jgi:hypothetical protein